MNLYLFLLKDRRKVTSIIEELNRWEEQFSCTNLKGQGTLKGISKCLRIKLGYFAPYLIEMVLKGDNREALNLFYN